MPGPIMRRHVAVALALAAALAVALPAHAAPGDVSKARDQLRNGQDAGLIETLRAADTKRQAIEESLAGITAKLDRVQRELADLQPKVDAAESALRSATAFLSITDSQLKRAKEKLGLSAAQLYAVGQWNDVMTIMNADDLASVASAQVYIEAVLHSSTAVLKGFRTTHQTALRQKGIVEAQTGAIRSQRQRLEAREADLLDAAQAKQKAANDLTAALVERAEALGAIGHDLNGFAVVSQSFGRATDGVKLLVGAAQQGQAVEEPRQGAIWWPVDGERVSSAYGWRIHPIWKKRSFHTGVDIPAPYGTKIKAARAGTVLEVAYVGAFGLLTVIDHGNSIATVYAHQSRTFVRPGDRVQAGQPIGAIGCTGWCTGPHIHFEIWSRGMHTNPGRWL
jgi:murein DD-endopeptidase MepM/ murein hydrolase activator NlpD